MNSENSTIDPAALIKAWANEEAEYNRQIEINRAFYDIEYHTRLSKLDAEYADLTAAKAEREKAVRAQLAAYIAQTGDTMRDVDGVTVRRVHPLRYDKAEALAWARENAPHLLRYKEPELDIRKFEAAIVNGQVRWDGAEQTNELQIVMGKLGHLVDQPENIDESDKAK